MGKYPRTLQPFQDNARLVRIVLLVASPAGFSYAEEVHKYLIRIYRGGEFSLDRAGSFELGETFQLIAGKTSQEVQDRVPTLRQGSPEQCAGKGRAGGDDGQG